MFLVPQDLTLKAAEKEAQDAGKGLWAEDASTHVRNVTWEVPDARQLVEQYSGRRIKAVVENVRDGSTVRAFLLPDFYHVTIMLSGVAGEWLDDSDAKACVLAHRDELTSQNEAKQAQHAKRQAQASRRQAKNAMTLQVVLRELRSSLPFVRFVLLS